MNIQRQHVCFCLLRTGRSGSQARHCLDFQFGPHCCFWASLAMICWWHVKGRHPHGCDMLWSEKVLRWSHMPLVRRLHFQWWSMVPWGSCANSNWPALIVLLGKAKWTVRQDRRSQTPNWAKDRPEEPFPWFNAFQELVTVLMLACNPWGEICASIFRWTNATCLYTFWHFWSFLRIGRDRYIFWQQASTS